MYPVESKIGWGVLGAAKINNRVLPSFARSRTSELVAIASRDVAKAKDQAEKFQAKKAYGSYEELLQDPEVQIIYNPLPNHLHAEFTRKAADAGKHILCEKPLTPDAASARDLVEYCRTKNVRLMDGFMWPHHPRTQILRKFLAEPRFANISKVIGQFTFLLEGLPTSNIRLQPEAGGGSLLDVGCYPVYGIRWALQEEPVSVFATAKTYNGCDIRMSGILQFSSGRVGLFDCGFDAPMRQNLEIVAEEFSLFVPQMWVPDDDAIFEVRDKNGRTVETHHIQGHDQIAYMIDDLAYAVLEKREAIPTPLEAVQSLKVLNALQKSAQSGRVEAVEI